MVVLYSLLESPNSDTDEFYSDSDCTVGKSRALTQVVTHTRCELRLW